MSGPFQVHKLFLPSYPPPTPPPSRRPNTKHNRGSGAQRPLTPDSVVPDCSPLVEVEGREGGEEVGPYT